ncbi:uncharacterized protein LOC144436763 [Glandiceps talaboti]
MSSELETQRLITGQQGQKTNGAANDGDSDLNKLAEYDSFNSASNDDAGNVIDSVESDDWTANEIKERWQYISFVGFIIGILIGSLVAGLVFGVSLDNKLWATNRRQIICQNKFASCTQRLDGYGALYGPSLSSNGCQNYVMENCDFTNGSTVICSNFNINLNTPKSCYRGNLNRTIECDSEGFVMETICPS